jgi:hypothetical protein
MLDSSRSLRVSKAEPMDQTNQTRIQDRTGLGDGICHRHCRACHPALAVGGVFVPYSKIGFWTRMLAALTETALALMRAMAAGFGFAGG